MDAHGIIPGHFISYTGDSIKAGYRPAVGLLNAVCLDFINTENKNDITLKSKYNNNDDHEISKCYKKTARFLMPRTLEISLAESGLTNPHAYR